MMRVLTVLVLLSMPSRGAAEGWELVAQADEVRCEHRHNPATGLPVARAVARVEAPLAEVLATIADVDSSCAWAGQCLVARITQRQDQTRFRMYTLRQGPPLIRNRDVELEVTIELEAHGQVVRANFVQAAHQAIPVPSGVVRMPLMRGHYLLRGLGPSLTEVELLIEGDPGGLIPRWVIPWAVKAVPCDSLKALRRWVPQFRGRYPELIRTFEELVRSKLPPPGP